MAEVTQTIVPVATNVSFDDVPTGENNIYPRGKICFQGQNSVTLKGAGDVKTLLVDFNLPPNFAYAIDQLILNLESATSATDPDQYDDLALLQVNHFSSVSGTTAITRIPLLSNGVQLMNNQSDSIKTWQTRPSVGDFKEVFHSPSGAAPLLIAQLFDTDGVGATAALTLRFYLTFLQYDIRQVNKVAVNSPMPVSVR